MREILKLNDSQYFGDKEHVSKSWLDLLEKSPAHLHTYLLCGRPQGESAAFRVGKMVHKYILEYDVFFESYIMEPLGCNKRTNAGKKLLLDFQVENAGKIIISQKEYKFLEDIRHIVLSNHFARNILFMIGNQYEIAVKWTAYNGVKCKAKADIFNPPESIVVDLKTFGNYKDFTDSIRDYRYEVQAAHYLDGFQAKRFIIIAVSKKLDWCECFELDKGYLESGLTKRNKNLDQYKLMHDGLWSGSSCPGVTHPTILSNPDDYQNDDVEFDL